MKFGKELFNDILPSNLSSRARVKPKTLLGKNLVNINIYTGSKFLLR